MLLYLYTYIPTLANKKGDFFLVKTHKDYKSENILVYNILMLALFWVSNLTLGIR